MLDVLVIILISIAAAFSGVVGLICLYRNTAYHKKQVERSLKMVPFEIKIPQK